MSEMIADIAVLGCKDKSCVIDLKRVVMYSCAILQDDTTRVVEEL